MGNIELSRRTAIVGAAIAITATTSPARAAEPARPARDLSLGRARVVAISTRQQLTNSIGAYLRSRPGYFSVGVRDNRTGAIWTYNDGFHNECASIVKLQIAAAVIRRATVAKRNLTSWEMSQLRPMILVSDNNAATNLWNSVGRAPAIQSVDRLLGMSSTTANVRWGLTRTTVRDQLTLVNALTNPSGYFTPSIAAYVVGLMRSVNSSQRWGAGSGVPSGTVVALKNGWLPLSSYGWRINSVGRVIGGGRNYSIAMLSRSNSTMGTGTTTATGVNQRVYAALAGRLV